MEWITRPLGEITSYMAKGIPPKYTEEETENTVRVLNQKCNRNFTISYADSRIHDCTQKKVPSDKLLKKGDVLINSTGTGTAGRVAQMMEIPIPTTIDGHMILLRPSKEMDAFYYGYAVKAHQAQIETLAEGSTGQTEINRNRLQTEVMITYPENKKVQAGIASFLWDIDRKIEANNKINENLPSLKQQISNTLKLENSSIPFQSDYGIHYFPQKVYKGVTYEEGEYESLLVTLGKGEGDNWWCVLFPPLCIMEAEETEVKEETEYKFFIQELIEKYL